jgi:aspartyl-tRNA synthetase
VKGHGFKVFDEAELVVGINAEGCAGWSRKQTDALIDFVKRPQIGATGIVFVKWTEEGLKSTVDKFYTLRVFHRSGPNASACSKAICCASWPASADKTRKQLNELRLHLGDLLGSARSLDLQTAVGGGLPATGEGRGKRSLACHAPPLHSPKPEHAHKLESDPGTVKANAYDLVINGTEIGGGSIRIHDRTMQEAMFRVLGFTDEDARYKFGFLMDAFEYRCTAPRRRGLRLRPLGQRFSVAAATSASSSLSRRTTQAAT